MLDPGRRRRPWSAVLVTAHLVLSASSHAFAADIEHIEATGLGSTRLETLTELLPRDLPASFTEDEIAELERRVRNLGLFDRVDVTVVGGVLHVDVDRKENVEPELAFSSGATLRDTEASGGVVHHDIDGKGTLFGVGAGYGERFAQFEIGLVQHGYRARKWSWELEGFYGGSEVRFEDGSRQWVRGRLGGEVELKPAYSYATPIRVELSLRAYAEKSVFAEGGPAPRGGTFVGAIGELYWDRWTFHDLVPRGLLVIASASPGFLIGANEPRHHVRLEVRAFAPYRERTVLAMRGVAEAVNAGNANHSLLLGSIEGVRGLPDTLFRDRAHAYANVELRHAIDLGRRWHVQPVIFADAARFQVMDANGAPMAARSALSVGAGVRLLPTALIDTCLRVDVARRLLPSATWFVQLGIDQYF
ncbi:MAG: hypothetical protein HYV09_24615 [Deltaproteobacteria bacterium]|nr:hypothetical protein [Deltaproteobacteria bacterium]